MKKESYKSGKIFLLSFILTFFTSTPVTAIEFSFTNLGTYSANCINNSGQVVVLIGQSFDSLRSGLWENGVITDLGTLGGKKTIASGMNDMGQVVGWSETAAGAMHAFLWDKGVMTDLGDGYANDINNLGQVVYGLKVAINDLGQKVGSVLVEGKLQAALWEDGNVFLLGTLGGEESWASDINDFSQVVGSSQTADGPTLGFIWDSTEGMKDLGMIGGPHAINNLGQMVGRYKPEGIVDPERDAFYWDTESGLVNLDELMGLNFYQASDINDAGQIVGYGYFGAVGESERFGFLLTPKPAITVTSPNGGEELPVGASHVITWESSGPLDSVKIEYSNNGGIDWTEIVGTTEDDGSHIWEVPFDLSDECLVRISDVETGAFDVSDDVFSIVGPDISISPSCHDFGTVYVGSSAAKVFFVGNTGTGDLSVGTINITGADASDFDIENDLCSNEVLEPSATCPLEVIFSPASRGDKNAILSVPSDDPDEPTLNVVLNGKGIEQYILTLTKQGTGIGNVTSEPEGIDCGMDCVEIYDESTEVILSAKALGGSVFSGWSGGGCSGTGGCVVTMNADITVIATFTRQYLLTVSKDGTGTGTVTSSPSGINCGSDCRETFDMGTEITLTATPDSGSILAGWSGGGCSGTGTCSVIMDADKTVTATFNLASEAAFTATPTEGPAPLTVNFTDASTGDITSWSWAFGDGGTSAVQNPTHPYDDPGTYTVSLTVTGPGGPDTETKTDYITVGHPAPVAIFMASPTSGIAPLLVNFTDQSTGMVISWFWDFGDGGTSTDQHPTHPYPNPGAYSVSLTVTGPGGTDTETKVNYIRVLYPAPVADFTANPTIGTAPLTVKFTERCEGSPTSWSWRFGDGRTSTARNPTHTYNDPGPYTVRLTVEGPGGAETEVKPDYILVYGPDLTGEWLKFRVKKKGKTIRGMFKVQNIGAKRAGKFKVRFYLSTNGITLGEEIGKRKIFRRGLPASKSETVRFEYRSKVSLLGKYVIAVVDADEQVAEFNEGNNEIVSRVNGGAKPLLWLPLLLFGD